MDEIKNRKNNLVKKALLHDIAEHKLEAKKIAEEMVYYAESGYEIRNGNIKIQSELNLLHMKPEEASKYCYGKKEELEKKHNEIITDILLLEISLSEFQ